LKEFSHYDIIFHREKSPVEQLVIWQD